MIKYYNIEGALVKFVVAAIVSVQKTLHNETI